MALLGFRSLYFWGLRFVSLEWSQRVVGAVMLSLKTKFTQVNGKRGLSCIAPTFGCDESVERMLFLKIKNHVEQGPAS